MTRETWIFADAHAHIYPIFNLAVYFHTALRRQRPDGSPLLLLLTESSTCHYFDGLGQHAQGENERSFPPFQAPNLSPSSLADFSIWQTAEPGSLGIRHRGSDAADLFLVAGRQLVGRERLEVLALGLSPAHALSRLPDGELKTEELVRQVLDAGAAAVLAWGFGKWIGARGREVLRLCQEPDLAQHPLFFLGDNPARCWPWPTPAVFKGPVRVLPGSDVLPMRGTEPGLAAYGFKVHGTFDRKFPARSLFHLLRRLAPLERVGRRKGPVSAITEQIRYRFRPKSD